MPNDDEEERAKRKRRHVLFNTNSFCSPCRLIIYTMVTICKSRHPKTLYCAAALPRNIKDVNNYPAYRSHWRMPPLPFEAFRSSLISQNRSGGRRQSP